MKNSRRAFFASAAAAIPAAAAAAASDTSNNPAYRTCARAVTGPNAKHFPHVIVQDQHQRKAWFYEDLLHDKLTLVSFTSVKGEKYYPVLNNLVKVQEMLGERLGSLEVGKDANLLFMSGDPLEVGSRIEAVMLEGEFVFGPQSEAGQ